MTVLWSCKIQMDYCSIHKWSGPDVPNITFRALLVTDDEVLGGIKLTYYKQGYPLNFE